MLNVTDGMIESGDVVQNFHLMNELRSGEVKWVGAAALLCLGSLVCLGVFFLWMIVVVELAVRRRSRVRAVSWRQMDGRGDRVPLLPA